MRIGLDIDDCIVDFWGSYCKRFTNPNDLKQESINKNFDIMLSQALSPKIYDAFWKIRKWIFFIYTYTTKLNKRQC